MKSTENMYKIVTVYICELTDIKQQNIGVNFIDSHLYLKFHEGKSSAQFH